MPCEVEILTRTFQKVKEEQTMPPKTDNRTNGGRFEQELAIILAKAGFWVHVLQQNKAGQPADLIVMKGYFAALIDCKVISDDSGFPLRRVEENQRCAMKSFSEKTNWPCFFAFKLPDGSIHFGNAMHVFCCIKLGKKSISDETIRKVYYSPEDWIAIAEEQSAALKRYDEEYMEDLDDR